MARGRISKTSAESITPGTRDRYLWDSELSGFGVKVTPAGGRVYLVQYRLGGRAGRTRRLTIGRHGSPWTADQARKYARAILGQVAIGRDPAEQRSERRRDITVADLCDLYLAEGCATKKPSTLAVDRGRIERHVKPLLGQKRVKELTRAEIEGMMRAVAAGRTAADTKTGPHGRAIVKGGKGTAAKAVILLGAILEFAIYRGLRPDNPAHGIKKYKEDRTERFLSAAELTRLGEALAAAEREGENPWALGAIRLLALTGCRKGEILPLRWEHVDFERTVLRLPDSKTGPKVVHIGAPALEFLAALPRQEDNPYVLPDAHGGHIVKIEKLWNKVRQQAGLPDVRLHDLRHSFAAIGATSGDSLLVIGKLLGHRTAAAISRYAHLADHPIKKAADRISGQIASAMTPTRHGEMTTSAQGGQTQPTELSY